MARLSTSEYLITQSLPSAVRSAWLKSTPPEIDIKGRPEMTSRPKDGRGFIFCNDITLTPVLKDDKGREGQTLSEIMDTLQKVKLKNSYFRVEK